MSDGPINPDREQQRADNIASRRQSGLEPMPKDRDEAADAAERDETREQGEDGGDAKRGKARQDA